MFLGNRDCQEGIFEIHFSHEVPWSKEVPQGADGLHLEVGDREEGVQPLEVDDWPPGPILLGNRKDRAVEPPGPEMGSIASFRKSSSIS